MAYHQPKYSLSIQKILNGPLINDSISINLLKPVHLVLQSPRKFLFDDITQDTKRTSKKRSQFIKQLLALWTFFLERIKRIHSFSSEFAEKEFCNFVFKDCNYIASSEYSNSASREYSNIQPSKENIPSHVNSNLNMTSNQMSYPLIQQLGRRNSFQTTTTTTESSRQITNHKSQSHSSIDYTFKSRATPSRPSNDTYPSGNAEVSFTTCAESTANHSSSDLNPMEEILMCQIIVCIIQRKEFLDEMDWESIHDDRLKNRQYITHLQETQPKTEQQRPLSTLFRFFGRRNPTTESVGTKIGDKYCNLLYESTLLALYNLKTFHKTSLERRRDVRNSHTNKYKEEKMIFCASVLGISSISILPSEVRNSIVATVCRTTLQRLFDDQKKRYKRRNDRASREKKIERKAQREFLLASDKLDKQDSFSKEDIRFYNSLRKVSISNSENTTFQHIISNRSNISEDEILEVEDKEENFRKSTHFMSESEDRENYPIEPKQVPVDEYTTKSHPEKIQQHMKNTSVNDEKETYVSGKINQISNSSKRREKFPPSQVTISQYVLDVTEYNLPSVRNSKWYQNILPQFNLSTSQIEQLLHLMKEVSIIIPSSKTFFNCFLQKFSDRIHDLNLNFNNIEEYRELLQVFSVLILDNRENADWMELSFRILKNKRTINLLLDIELSNTNAFSVDAVFRSLDRSEKWISAVGKTPLLRTDLLIKTLDAALATDHFRISSKVLVFFYNIFDDLHPNVRLVVMEYLLKNWGVYLLCHWHNDVRICFFRLLVYKLLKRPSLITIVSQGESNEISEWEDRASVTLKSKAETYIYVLNLYFENPRFSNTAIFEATLPEYMKLSSSQRKYVPKAIQDLASIQEEFKKWEISCFLPFKERIERIDIQKQKNDKSIEHYSHSIPYPSIRLPNFSLKDM